MKIKRPVKIVLISVCAVCLAGFIAFSITMGIKNRTAGFQTESGGVLPIPPVTWQAGHYKINGIKFKTSLSEQEVESFYQKYFDSLPCVTMPGYFTEDSSKLYYDEQQHLIILEELHFMHEWDGLYFAVMYEPYGDGVGVRIAGEPKNAQ